MHALVKLSKTTSPQKRFDNHCINLYLVAFDRREGGGAPEPHGPLPRQFSGQLKVQPQRRDLQTVEGHLKIRGFYHGARSLLLSLPDTFDSKKFEIKF